MADPLLYFRVWCVTDSQYERVWSRTEPTSCPVNGGHTITASKTVVEKRRDVLPITMDAVFEAAASGASNVVANDRPALEHVEDLTSWTAAKATWPHEQNDAAKLVLTAQFILKALGTGTVARLAARAKSQGSGEDSSASWADTQYVDITISHTTLGEVFEGVLTLDASGFHFGDAVALQLGRDGSHANDTLDQSLQIIGIQAEAV